MYKLNDERLGTIRRPALCRKAKLGDLYNARNDTFCNTNLFKQNIPSSAVESSSIPFTDLTIRQGTSLSEKFQLLGIEGGLKLSVLAGTCWTPDLNSYGKFLTDETSEERTTSCSLHYAIRTMHERLNIAETKNLEIANHAISEGDDNFSIDTSAIATHVVVEIYWGANVFLGVEHRISSNIEDQVKSLVGEIQSCILAKVKVSAKQELEVQSKSNDLQLNFKIHGDFLPPSTGGQDLSLVDAVQFMWSVPQLTATKNEGRGNPVEYVLVPIQTLLQNQTKQVKIERIFDRIEDSIVEDIAASFDQIRSIKIGATRLELKLSILSSERNSGTFAIEIEMISLFKSKVQKAEEEIQAHLRRARAAAGNGESEENTTRVPHQTCQEIVHELKFNLDKIENLIQETIELRTFFTKNNVHILETGVALRAFLLENSGVLIYVLLCCENTGPYSDDWYKNREFFMNLVGRKSTISFKTEVRFAYYSSTPKNTTTAGSSSSGSDFMNANTSRILLYKGSNLEMSDVYQKEMAPVSIPTARSAQLQFRASKPTKRVSLSLKCPGAFKSGESKCDKDLHNWLCFDCSKLIEYGFDNQFYCGCGSGSSETYEFKCNDQVHHTTTGFLMFETQILRAQLDRLKEYREINILVLGETGVGKSTWINAFANYLNYQSFDEAVKNGLLALITTTFTMTDDNYEEQIITMKSNYPPTPTATNTEQNTSAGRGHLEKSFSSFEDEGADVELNEFVVIGQSATQNPVSYVFNLDDSTMVRLIDTPGVGDTRGLATDKLNFQRIMDHISHYGDLQAILILLKPNNARLTVMLEFCIKELLTHLHVDASKNILFCFTNCRSTFYKPGETLTSLKKLLADSKVVDIPLSKRTIYCMDNEPVRFLAALEHNISFCSDDIDNFKKSWEKSMNENQRLFQHILSLAPHQIRNTLSLNESRRLIVELGRPIAEISENIQSNIGILEEHTRKIETGFTDNLSEIPGIKLRTKSLQEPLFICKSCTPSEAISCSMMAYSWGGLKLKSYYLPGIKWNCATCRCDFDNHLISYIDCDRIETTNESKAETFQQKVDEINDRVCQLEIEQQKIIHATSVLAHFLKTNAITPYNDAVESYLDILIRKEDFAVKTSQKNSSVLEKLQRMKDQYLSKKQVLEKAMNDSKSTQNLINPQDIQGLVEGLYNLPLYGRPLRKLVSVQHYSSVRQRKHFEKHWTQEKPAKSSFIARAFDAAFQEQFLFE